MALVNMALGEDEIYAEPSRNKYGYGLCISLNEAQCEALGITMPMQAGSKVTINAVAYVERATQSVDGEDMESPDVCLSLQITDLELTGGDRSQSIASKLYGD